MPWVSYEWIFIRIHFKTSVGYFINMIHVCEINQRVKQHMRRIIITNVAEKYIAHCFSQLYEMR